MANNNEKQIDGTFSLRDTIKQNIYDHVYAACRRDWDWMPPYPKQEWTASKLIEAFGIGQLANLTLSMPIWSFIEYCKVNKAGKSWWRAIELNYKDMLPDWDMLVRDVDAKYANLMGEVARMRASGASVDEIEAFMNSTLEAEA